MGKKKNIFITNNPFNPDVLKRITFPDPKHPVRVLDVIKREILSPDKKSVLDVKYSVAAYRKMCSDGGFDYWSWVLLEYCPKKRVLSDVFYSYKHYTEGGRGSADPDIIIMFDALDKFFKNVFVSKRKFDSPSVEFSPHTEEQSDFSVETILNL